MARSKARNLDVPLDLFVGNILGAFARGLCDKIEKAVTKATGRNSTACSAIVHIGSEPGSSIEKLRRMLNLEHSSVVRLLDRLEQAMLVKRTRRVDEDHRKVSIVLTDQGEIEFGRILDARREILNRTLDVMDGSEKSFLMAMIKKLMPEVVDRGDDQHFVCRLCDLEMCPQEHCPVNQAYPENVDEVTKPFRRKVVDYSE